MLSTRTRAVERVSARTAEPTLKSRLKSSARGVVFGPVRSALRTKRRKKILMSLSWIFGVFVVVFSIAITFRSIVKLWLARLMVTRSRRKKHTIEELEQKHVQQDLKLRP